MRIFRLPGVQSSAAEVGKEQRNYDIFFGAASQVQTEIIVKIPPRFKVKYLPPAIELDLPAVSYHAGYRLLDETTIVYRKQARTKAKSIPVSAYHEYKRFREKIAKFGEESIVLEERHQLSR